MTVQGKGIWLFQAFLCPFDQLKFCPGQQMMSAYWTDSNAGDRFLPNITLDPNLTQDSWELTVL